ncbi:28S ribosomal protein S5, mitochondrial [Paramarasmius palmivorus]|uniref:28S ribosomal protein S5, mitochondrial n=1 Tax=Paramarasmius palmivorus TaxID=297713 RepID=A0AAW0D0S4_9AGAR
MFRLFGRQRYATNSDNKFTITDRPSLQLLLTSSNPSIQHALREIQSRPEQNSLYNTLLRRFLKTPLHNPPNLSALRGLREIFAKWGVSLDIESLEKAQEEVLAIGKGLDVGEEFTPSQESIDIPNRPYPNLMSPDPLMDSMELLDIPPTETNPYHNRVIERNVQSFFVQSHFMDNPPEWRQLDDGTMGWDVQYPPKGVQPTKTDLNDEEVKENELANVPHNFKPKYAFPLLYRFVTQQTGKGKIHRNQAWMVIGNGDGLVGIGSGTDGEPSVAWTKARINALKNLEYIHRFENRTIWTEMSMKFRSTEIKMRPRPVGFGLRCGPIVHQVLKAGGIKDISAKVWGSRNPLMIMQGLTMMLGGGHNPLGFGDGAGGKGKRLGKGYGMRTKGDVERDRGRRVEVFRK